jgi:hypothetical protein
MIVVCLLTAIRLCRSASTPPSAIWLVCSLQPALFVPQCGRVQLFHTFQKSQLFTFRITPRSTGCRRRLVLGIILAGSSSPGLGLRYRTFDESDN